MTDTDTITAVGPEHVGASLLLTFEGAPRESMTVWSLANDAFTVNTADLLRQGGTLGEYNRDSMTARISVPATVREHTIDVLGHRLDWTDVNLALLGGTVTEAAAPPGTHVMLQPGLYMCRAHREVTDREGHYFVVAPRRDGEGGVAQLHKNNSHGTLGVRRSFADYPDCDPVAGATMSVLFGTDHPEVAVRVAPTHFSGTTRIVR